MEKSYNSRILCCGCSSCSHTTDEWEEDDHEDGESVIGLPEGESEGRLHDVLAHRVNQRLMNNFVPVVSGVFPCNWD